MNDRKRTLIEADDRGWTEFRSLIDPLTPEQVTLDGYYPDWSVKDLMAHMGCWMAEAGVVLEQIRMDTFAGWNEDIDETNRRWYEEWRGEDLRTVWAELHSSRARMLDEWNLLREVTPDAEEWFRDSTECHYDEHVPRLREWLAELSG